MFASLHTLRHIVTAVFGVFFSRQRRSARKMVTLTNNKESTRERQAPENDRDPHNDFPFNLRMRSTTSRTHDMEITITLAFDYLMGQS